MAEDSIYEVERILARRRTRKGKLEYMVQWKNFGSEEDTWEPLENLGDCLELVEEFNRKTLKEGNFDKITSLDSIKKKPNGGKKKQGDSGKETLTTEHGKDSAYNGKEKHGNGKEKHGNGKEKHGNGKERQGKEQVKSKEPTKTNPIMKNESSNLRTNCHGDAGLGKMADGSAKAQKRKRESDANNGAKRTNGPVMPPPSSLNNVKTDKSLPEKRVKRAHSITGAVAQGSSMSSASNGLGSPLQRRRINSSMSSEGLHLNTRTSPMMGRSLSTSPYPKLILSPTKVISVGAATRKGSAGGSGGPVASHGHLPAFSAPGPGGGPGGGGEENKGGLQSRRTASIVARRRLSQSSPSAEDLLADSRRISARQNESLYKYKEIVVKKCSGYTQIRLFTTTPTRNALNLKALQELTNVFETSKKDDSKVIFLSGSGSVFCSGLDLRYLQTSFVEERKRASKSLADAVRAFVDSIISCPKIVVVAVNGPAIGLGAAILPLCDIAYASDKAYFHLPYSILSQTPEGCASHTFPQVLGLAVAGEMLYAGRKLTALEACACGLVAHTFWPTSFMQEVVPRVQRIATQSSKGLLQSKLLVKGQMRAKLEYVNESECNALEERWRSPEFYRQIKLFAENYSDM